MSNTPLAVLDLVPISWGDVAIDALRKSIDLAAQTERLGYTRYWLAEHHLNPGVAGTSPAPRSPAERSTDSRSGAPAQLDRKISRTGRDARR